MIMDEVLAVGDMKFQKKCLSKMKDAATEDGKTVLYVSHNMNTIRQLCNRCIVLEKGQIVFEGDTESAIAVYMRNPFILLIVGFVYVAESLSVIIQVTYFKKTGKRIFKMSPIHHHFEMCGLSEKKIVLLFSAVTLVLGVIGYFGI